MSFFFFSSDYLSKPSTIHSHCPAPLQRTRPASFVWLPTGRGESSRRAHVCTCCTDCASIDCLTFFLMNESSEWRWRPALPLLFCTVSDLFDVSLRCLVQVDSLCWRISASSVIPPVLSATGTSFFSVLPVESVRNSLTTPAYRIQIQRNVICIVYVCMYFFFNVLYYAKH